MNSAQVKSKITDMSGWTTMFKAGTRIHLTYVINSVNDTPPRIFYTFLNGVTSSLSAYTETDQFIDLSEDVEKNIFDSEFIFDSSQKISGRITKRFFRERYVTGEKQEIEPQFKRFIKKVSTQSSKLCPSAILLQPSLFAIS